MRLLSDKNLKVVAALALVIIAFAFVAPYLGLSTVPGAGLQPAVQTSTGGVCPSTGVTDLRFQAQYRDTSTGNDVPINTTVSVYEIGGTNPLFTGTTSSSGGYVSVGTINCGKGAVAFVGDGGTSYYYQKVELSPSQTQEANTNVLAKLKKSSSVSVTFQNSSGSAWTATTTQSGVGAGATNSDVRIRIKAGQYYFGDGAFEICAQYPLSNISKVSFGAEAAEIGMDRSLSVAAGTDTRCYEVKAEMAEYATKELPVVIQAAPGVTPNNASIRIYVNDATARIKNGQLTDKYFNSDTNADLGLPALNIANAIVVNPS